MMMVKLNRYQHLGRKSRKRKILLENVAHETKARNQNVAELVSTMKTLAESQESENPSHP